MLTSEQVSRYREDGYLVMDDVFSADEVEALRDACESAAVVDGLERSGIAERTVHLLEITTKHPAFKELARDPRIVGRLVPLLGENLQLQHSKLASKPTKPGRGPFAWHQDFAYFPHTNTDLAAVMVMLDDATPENGGMSVVRGSHKWGLLNHLVDGWFTGTCQEPERWSDESRVVPLTPKAGGVSVHHCLTLHSSPPNFSGRPRRGIVFQYRAADAYQLADHVWVDTGFQVSGEPSLTARCEAATFSLPRWKSRTPHFGNAWNQEGVSAGEWNAL